MDTFPLRVCAKLCPRGLAAKENHFQISGCGFGALKSEANY
jgi:hypothetical protein